MVIIGDTILQGGATHIPLSGVTAYHLLEGSLALASTTPTSGFSTTLYTGNGSTQSINTGVDMATQWGNDATEVYGGLVWVKNRSTAGTDHRLCDTVRGQGHYLVSNQTYADATNAGMPTFLNSGFSITNAGDINTSSATYASWNFQTTHRITGTTNHGKAYTCHYNPYTGFTMVKYEGSGLAGHEIPHSLGRKLAFCTVKNLTTAGYNWVAIKDGNTFSYLNATNAFNTVTWNNGINLFTETSVTTSYEGAPFADQNASANTYILYGWANSYFDSANTLIGNYEIGVYQGTGASGNKVTTRGKPAWVVVKRLDSTSNWQIYDNKRTPTYTLRPNASEIENNYDPIIFLEDGLNITNSGTTVNASGGQYLYMVVYDNDSGSGKSKYHKPADAPVINLTAKVPFANGVDVNGTKLSILSKNESISGVTLSQGKNYVYCDNTGAYGKSTVAPSYGVTNPASGGDFFNLNTFKWYTSAGAEIINSRNYLDAIVYGDTSGNAEYIEQLPKTVYYDRVKANRYEGKNACTAWVNFDGTTTPPTIRDSFNVSSVVRTATGAFDIYFEKPMDTFTYSAIAVSQTNGSWADRETDIGWYASNINKVLVRNIEVGGGANPTFLSLQVFGGRN